MNIMSERILLGHGSGGKLMDRLIRDSFVPALDNEIIRRLGDAAVLDVQGVTLAFTTDSYVISPLFFPGGDIGILAVSGTVNDLAVSGARPLYLSIGLIIEEGFALGDLKRIYASIRTTAEQAGVLVVTGDTKVVNRGEADGLFINTSGIGVIRPGVETSGRRARPGDKVLLSGTLGDHGISVMVRREGLEIEVPVESDVAPLNGMIHDLLELGEAVLFLRDPTRGGLASALNEFAQATKLAVELREDEIPVRSEVRGVCELLGLDPLYVANEGKCVAVVRPDCADRALEVFRSHPLGREAREIGRIVENPPGKVLLLTEIGGTRIVDTLIGEQLPRIC
jgi:hydrogenase expression/formation protein HypE